MGTVRAGLDDEEAGLAPIPEEEYIRGSHSSRLMADAEDEDGATEAEWFMLFLAAFMAFRMGP